MPKNKTKNIDRYKIRGGDINEFEYDQNQEQLAKPKPTSDAKLIPGTPPEQREGRRMVVAKKASKKPRKKPTKKATKKTSKTTKKTTKGTAARKGAAKKK